MSDLLHAEKYRKDSEHGKVTFDAGKGTVVVSLYFQTSVCHISLHGATVLSWCANNSQDEQLFLCQSYRDAATYAPPKAIRGGVPICFPQFGPGALPQHGFARNSVWSIADSQVSSSSTGVTLQLSSSEATKQQWPHDFVALYNVQLMQNTLQLQLTVRNTGASPLEFTAALHTYFRVPDVECAAVHGLKGLTYVDKTRDYARVVEESGRVVVKEEVDRAYCDVPDVGVQLDTGARRVSVDKKGFPDVVVWNPHAIRTKSIGDLRPDEWKEFICIEAAIAHNPVTVAAGSEWTGSQILSLK